MAEPTTPNHADANHADENHADEKNENGAHQQEMHTGSDQSDTKTTSTAESPSHTGIVLKDLALVFAALSIWAAADTWYQVTGLWLANIIAIGDAVLVGLLLAGLAHEWGHYLGARFSNAQTTLKAPAGLSLLRFDFDFESNDQRQFHWMTYGGHVAHWAIFILMLIALPLDGLGRIALVSAIFGFIAFATYLEYNIVKDTWGGMDPKTRLSQLTPGDFKQSTIIGAIAGLFALAALA